VREKKRDFFFNCCKCALCKKRRNHVFLWRHQSQSGRRGDGESERAREESGLQYANEIIAGVLRHAGRPQPPSPAPSRHKRKGFYRQDLRKVFCGHCCGVENEKIIGEVIQEQAIANGTEAVERTNENWKSFYSSGAAEAELRFLARTLARDPSATSALSPASSISCCTLRYLARFMAAISSASSTWRL